MIIRLWGDGGRGKHKDVPAGDSTILDIQPLRDGGVVYASAEPALGRLDAIGKQTLFNGPATANYLGNREGFLLSEDVATVQFAFKLYGKSEARFSLTERR